MYGTCTDWDAIIRANRSSSAYQLLVTHYPLQPVPDLHQSGRNFIRQRLSSSSCSLAPPNRRRTMNQLYLKHLRHNTVPHHTRFETINLRTYDALLTRPLFTFAHISMIAQTKHITKPQRVTILVWLSVDANQSAYRQPSATYCRW
ncbi:uncharacterized protein LOC118512665 [Anopheles stephensi]|uniref:uncharacterized protein LOC118512665 n=1 Tax=Anopheles stephensi TaxID=30069 RepID=UPI0016587805|nr:uncharacterized protein LOC118512665 [Anopheles stephensi]